MAIKLIEMGATYALSNGWRWSLIFSNDAGIDLDVPKKG